MASERKRMREVDVRRLMLDEGGRRVIAAGSGPNFADIRLEDVIASANVPRSSAYRLWRSREVFTDDLLRDLVERNNPLMAPDQESWSVLRSTVDPVQTGRHPEQRLDLALELVRLGAAADFEQMVTGRAWQLHIALASAVPRIADDSLRRELLDGLAQSENSARSQLVERYMAVAAALRLRLRDPGLQWTSIVRMVMSQMRGAAVELLTQGSHESNVLRVALGPSGSQREWTTVAWVVGAVLLSAVEADDAPWTDVNERALRSLFGEA